MLYALGNTFERVIFEQLKKLIKRLCIRYIKRTENYSSKNIAKVIWIQKGNCSYHLDF